MLLYRINLWNKISRSIPLICGWIWNNRPSTICGVLFIAELQICLSETDAVEGMCKSERRGWYTRGCPSKFGLFAVLVLGAYIISYAPGIGTLPWIVNSEIYPLRYRGKGGGIAAVSNWVSNLIVSQTFLTLTEATGPWAAFLLFAAFALVGLTAIFLLLLETKGLLFEEVEKMLEKGFRPNIFRHKSKDNEPQQPSQVHNAL